MWASALLSAPHPYHVLEPMKGMEWGCGQVLRGQKNQGAVYIDTLQLVTSSGSPKEEKVMTTGDLTNVLRVCTNQGSKRYKEPAVVYTPEIQRQKSWDGKINPEFKGSLYYRVRFCLKNKTQTNKQTNKPHEQTKTKQNQKTQPSKPPKL